MSDSESNGTEEATTNLGRALQEFRMPTLCENFSWCSLVFIAIICVVPSLYDVFSDYYLGIAYICDDNYVWGILTILLTLAPGIHWSTYKSLFIGDNPSWCQAIFFTFSCLAFPVMLVIFKVMMGKTSQIICPVLQFGMLINHGPAMKFLGIWLTGCEMGYESIPQLCLQVKLM